MSKSSDSDFPAVPISSESPLAPPITTPPTKVEIASWIIAGLALLMVMPLHLLPTLLAGMLVYQLVHAIAPLLDRRPTSARARMFAVLILSTVIVGAITGAILLAVAFFRSEAGSYAGLMKTLAEIIEKSRATMPDWINEHIPTEADELRRMFTDSLRKHAPQLQDAGKHAGVTFAHIFVGMVLGAVIALREMSPVGELRPFGRALLERASRFSDSFRSVVFAQVRISALNTFFTAIYLLAILPLFGVKHLPLTKTIIGVTFLAGLIPVVGNLISNTLIVIVGLSHSPQVALCSLGFLIVIHKLEYFMNAKIIGSQIHASAWELLLAMIVMEAAFGLPGVMAAPIYYAYIKQELGDRGLV